MDYRAPVQEILFALRHTTRAASLPDWDDALAAEVLTQAGRFVDRELAPLDPIGDRTPALLRDGRVRLPPAFVEAYGRYREGGWAGLATPERYGGQALPDVLTAALSEMAAGACVSLQTLLSRSHGAIRALLANGSPAQKAQWLPRLASGEWLASMCMTEPQAGSDLALVRCSARPDGEHWRITGGKIFISGGDQDLTGKVLHFVLARTPDAPAGVRGLSLFLCPAELPDGSRNALSVVRLEEKMGLHALPSCQMAFDGAWAEVVGRPGEGLARMFTMLNGERLEVAMQGVGLSEIAAQRSTAYAEQRRQGGLAPGEAETMLISRHPDVRRMLLTQQAIVLGCRTLAYDVMVEYELGQRQALVEFLTPVCKGFITDQAIEAAQAAIQVHGGYGYLREYRVEQILRDARITQIYEGTNGIQAVTLAGRLLHGRLPVQAFAAWVEETARPEDLALHQAFRHWRQATEHLIGIPRVGIQAASYLRLTGLTAFAVAWARLEAAAAHAPDPERLRAAGRFARTWLLPETELCLRRCITEV